MDFLCYILIFIDHDDHKKLHLANFAGSLLDSEDDLFLGTDAQIFSASLPPSLSPGSSDSVSTG